MANMPVQIDWSELYSDLMSDRETKRGIAAAGKGYPAERLVGRAGICGSAGTGETLWTRPKDAGGSRPPAGGSGNCANA